MKTLKTMIDMVISPRKTSLLLAQRADIFSAISLVLGFSGILSLLFFNSYRVGSYPPPPDELNTWIEVWGEFAMLPFVRIPASEYRLWLAIIMIPMALSAWILMAGTARLLSILFHGHASYLQYLNLMCFSFFPFWILTALLDMVYSTFLDPYIVPALNMAYGPLARTFFLYFPMIMYPSVLTLGGIYNAIATQTVEKYKPWKSAITGALTFVWPTLLITVLLR
jgi:hypothetical protein